jgi:hypothetical protein
LHGTGGLAALAEPAALTAWLAELRQQAWVVSCTPPFAGPEHMLAYLGRYTHRVALSNERLVAVADGRVRFRWRDSADGDRVKVLDLDVDEFLRRSCTSSPTASSASATSALSWCARRVRQSR